MKLEDFKQLSIFEQEVILKLETISKILSSLAKENEEYE